MLVYAKNPRGVLYIDGEQIWGCETGQQPKDIPWELYYACRDALQHATMREGYLARKFGTPFPPVAFTYSEVRFLPESTLYKLAECMNISQRDELTKKGLIDAIKKEIRNES